VGRSSFTKETLNLAIITRSYSGGEAVIEHSSFTECLLQGPVHLRIRNNVEIRDCDFKPSDEECVVRLAEDEPYVGAVWLDNCEFVDCKFVNVKLIATPEAV
jgi:hypothetical protein